MRSLVVLAFLALASTPASAACSCCETPKTDAVTTTTGVTTGTPAPAAPVGHPLKGVVLEIIEGRSSLLVKHEEIPGFMKAMTMLLKVDAPTLAAAKKGQAITATLIKKSDGWWLENVSPVAAP